MFYPESITGLYIFLTWLLKYDLWDILLTWSRCTPVFDKTFDNLVCHKNLNLTEIDEISFRSVLLFILFSHV
jgi:hypothetical protein